VRINDFEHLIQEIKSKALSSSDEYISLMKTVGNNYKYDFTSQLSIYNQNTSARACGEFDFWRKKFGRTVKRGEKGIPIYKNYGEYGKVTYIFDLSQTVSLSRTTNQVELWELSKGEDSLREVLGHDGAFNKNEIDEMTIDEILESIAYTEVTNRGNYILNELKVDLGHRKTYNDFLTESIKIGYASRLDINYQVDRAAFPTCANPGIKLFTCAKTFLSLISTSLFSSMASSAWSISIWITNSFCMFSLLNSNPLFSSLGLSLDLSITS
jgi:hypothetical protein